ncbi:MAG: methylated-DNA-[protein]-cysteine S-methyltransferase [Verrucomicrobia bacterium]|nr:MAG: methylated-DNA-[protein]-cysteine S-methyltransferase [Verrucomicrobiota bacterium]
MMQFDSMPRAPFPTALGTCAVSWSETGLTGFELPDAPGLADAAAQPPAAIAALIVRVQRHLTGELQDFADVHYDLKRVPEFPREVYHATLAVKAGQTASYGDIAARLGYAPGMSRAVGTALGANPWPLLVPCHRIVSADGKMTGFSGPGGVKTKLRLLALEGAQLFAE